MHLFELLRKHSCILLNCVQIQQRQLQDAHAMGHDPVDSDPDAQGFSGLGAKSLGLYRKVKRTFSPASLPESAFRRVDFPEPGGPSSSVMRLCNATHTPFSEVRVPEKCLPTSTTEQELLG